MYVLGHSVSSTYVGALRLLSSLAWSMITVLVVPIRIQA